MKIATFNINNINKRLNNLTAWLAREHPNVVCLQELKAEQRAFPASALCDLGYRGVWLPYSLFGASRWTTVSRRASWDANSKFTPWSAIFTLMVGGAVGGIAEHSL